jgi:Mrp family chromosome partitioning ATPase
MHSIRRLPWLVGVGLGLGVTGGLIGLDRSVPVYASEASVRVLPTDNESVNLVTEAQMLRSTDIATEARLHFDSRDTGLPTVEALPGSSVLVIRFEANNPAVAQAGARAFADAYLADRLGAARAALNDQINAKTIVFKDISGKLAEANATLARLTATSPELTQTRSDIASYTQQINDLGKELNQLNSLTVAAGQVIGEPELPTSPVRPLRWRYLTAGGLLGAMLAAAAGLAWGRLSWRVHGAADLDRHRGVGVLADLPAEAIAVGTAPQHPSARAFNRLRNEVVAALGEEDRILLVTGASPGCASMMVAANLAAALARAENDVVLIGASVPELDSATPAATTTLAEIFDVGDIPGLTDVLSGRTSLTRAVQRAARSPRLRIVTPGGTASATGLLQSEGARGVLSALGRRARYVVVEAPSTASGADAQSLARAADAAVLVVETGRTRHSQVADATMQLDRVGIKLLGTVVVPRLRPRDLEASRDAVRARSTLDLNTETWLGTNAALEAPTTRLAQVVRRETPVPHDQVDTARRLST